MSNQEEDLRAKERARNLARYIRTVDQYEVCYTATGITIIGRMLGSDVGWTNPSGTYMVGLHNGELCWMRRK